MSELTVTRLGVVTSERDSQGNFVRGADTTFTIDVDALAPNVAEETNGDVGVQVITGYRVYGVKDVVLMPTDRLTIRGVTGWQVQGEVGLWESPWGSALGGTEFVVRRAS